MTNTPARIRKNSKHFEILVDLEEALKIKNNAPDADITKAVLTDAVFYNLKVGDIASNKDLEESFGTTDLHEVAEKIIKEGEVVKPTDFLKKEQEEKYKQVVDFLVRNAVSPEGIPYTPDRIKTALKEAHVNIKNKPIEEQVEEILDQLRKVLPIKIEQKKFKITISSLHIGKAYGLIKSYIIKEEWMPNGNLNAIIQLPAGIMIDFFEKLNKMTEGSVLSEEIKE